MDRDLRSSHRSYLFATRLNHPVDHRGQTPTSTPVSGDACFLHIGFTKHEVRFHRTLAFYLDQSALLRLVTPRLQELRVYVQRNRII